MVRAYHPTYVELPALSESSLLRYVAFTVLYVAQGIVVGLFLYAFPPYLAERGLSLGTIGSFVGITMLPWSLKLVGGPIMDRWSFRPMGRRRPWVVATQVGALLSLLTLALIPEPLSQLPWLIIGGFTFNIFIAFQDVAIDGMAVDVLPLNEQGRANGLMFGGQALGFAGVTAGGTWLLSTSGPRVTFLLVAILPAITIVVSLLLRERPGERLLPWSEGQATGVSVGLAHQGWRDIGGSLLRTLILPMSLIAVAGLFFYRVGFGLLTTTLPVIAVQQLGWTGTAYSQLKAAAEFAGAVAGMTVFGFLADRFGRVRMAKIGGLIVVVLTVVMGLLPKFWPARMTLELFVFAYTLTNLLVFIVYTATMMALCRKQVAATQFSLYMAISNLGFSTGSTLLGPLNAIAPHTYVFFVVAGCYAVMVLLVRVVNLKLYQERLDRIDCEEARKTKVKYE